MTMCKEILDELLKDVKHPEDLLARGPKMSPSKLFQTFGTQVPIGRYLK